MVRTINIFKNSIYIALKSFTEYKINFYSALVASFAAHITSALFAIIFLSQFNELLPWTIKEIIFFLLLTILISEFFGTFWYGMFRESLGATILRGNLNDYLIKPTNPFFLYLFQNTSYVSWFPALAYGGLFFIYSLFFIEINLIAYILALLIAAFGGTYQIIFFRLIDSLSFFAKRSHTILFTPFVDLTTYYSRFPANAFKENIYKFSLIVPKIYFSSVATHFYFGHMSIEEYFFHLAILITLLIIFILGIIFNWKIGLKNYEAFS